MANLIESAVWEAAIYQLETSDPVLGGPDGIDNLQAKQLGNRTTYLKQHVDALESGTTAAGKASKWTTARSISTTGDAFWTVSLDGSTNVSSALTLAPSGVAAGTYPKVTVDAKGRVTGGAGLAAADIPALDWSKITSGKPTTLAGYGITDAQPLDSDLTALAALTTTGLYVNTGVGTVAARSITAGTGISVSNGGGVAGNPVITNTGVTSLTGTANQVTVSASTGGVTLSLPQAIHSGAKPSFAQVTLAADPVSALDAATKQYVDNVAAGLEVKMSVRAASTAPLTLSGAQTVDGVVLAAGDRVLVKNQATASQNGLYTVGAGAWTRTTDADVWGELVSAFVFVESGTTNADSGWVCTVDPGGTLGTTPITWTQFAGAGTVTAGTGLSVSGNQVALANSGVAAGTYPKVTVDVYGRVTGGAGLAAADIPALDWSKITSGKPTTLAGYGITDLVAVRDSVQSWTRAQRGAVQVLTDAATIAVDLSLANNFSVTLAGNRTLGTPTNAAAGQSGIIAVTQDASGSRTLAFGSGWKFAGGTAPALSTAAGAVDYLAYYVESSTRVYVSAVKDVR